MQTIVDWLATHPEAKVDKAQLFQLSQQEAMYLPLRDPHCLIAYIEALSSRAADHAAPAEVREKLG